MPTPTPGPRGPGGAHLAQLDNLPGGLGARRGLFLPGGRPSPGGLEGGDRGRGWRRRRKGGGGGRGGADQNQGLRAAGRCARPGSLTGRGLRPSRLGRQRLYWSLISISLAGVSQLGAVKGPPTAVGWCLRAWRRRRSVPATGRRPPPILDRSLKSRVGGSGSPAVHYRPPAPFRSLRLKACPSQAGEATRPCAVPTELPPPSPGRRRSSH